MPDGSSRDVSIHSKMDVKVQEKGGRFVNGHNHWPPP